MRREAGAPAPTALDHHPLAIPDMTETSPLISICDVSVRFPGVLALDQISLDITTGELHAIVGENGAGKSTLMKVLAGVHSTYDGQVLLRGQPQTFSSTK